MLADADLEAGRLRTAVKSRLENAGQSCIGAKRFIVEAAVHDDFVERFSAATRALVVGDPAEPATNVGPMARADCAELTKLVDPTLAGGGKLAVGGRNGRRSDYFYQKAAQCSSQARLPPLAGGEAPHRRVRGDSCDTAFHPVLNLDVLLEYR